MTTLKRAVSGVRELWLVALIAIVVVVVSTGVRSVFDHSHVVDAEELTAQEIPAVAAGDTQVVTFKDWQVKMTLPLAPEMPLLNYTDHAGSSIGLSSADLSPLGEVCHASRNALGTVLRFPAGNFLAAMHGSLRARLITTIDGYDYGYEYPQNACSGQPGAQAIINRETSVLNEALSSLVSVREAH